MRTIKLPGLVWFEMPNGADSATIPIEIFNELPKLRLDVLAASDAIEAQLIKMLSWLLFPYMSVENRSLRTSLVLESSWCTFESKRTLFISITENVLDLAPEDKNTLEQTLSKVIRYRNAFTHGRLHASEPHPTLTYFRAKPIKDTLTDQYLQKIEETFNLCWTSLEAIESKLVKIERI